MATDPKRRQKALAKKAAKRKTKSVAARAATPVGLIASARLSTLPIHECLVPTGLFERGIGNVLVARCLPNGDIVTGGFLVDAWCLGVKDALLRIDSEARYEDWVGELLIREEDLEEVEPTHAKKLLRDAIAYAHELGFPPHPDYRKAARILEGIDAAACGERFPFGHEGKPFFCSGPNDTPARCRSILNTLQARFGPEGFHFVVEAHAHPWFQGCALESRVLEAQGQAALPAGPVPAPESMDE